MIEGVRLAFGAERTHRMKPTEAHTLPKTLGTFPLWGIAVGLVISGEYFGWSYGWSSAGTLGFLITACFIALMYATFIFSFTELTTAIPHAGGPFEYSRRAFGPTGGYVAGFATLVEFVFAPPAIALAIGAYVNVQFPALEPKWVALGGSSERQCRAALDAYAMYGESLRLPVEAMLQRASAPARATRSRLCEWPPHWSASVR